MEGYFINENGKVWLRNTYHFPDFLEVENFKVSEGLFFHGTLLYTQVKKTEYELEHYILIHQSCNTEKDMAGAWKEIRLGEKPNNPIIANLISHLDEGDVKTDGKGSFQFKSLSYHEYISVYESVNVKPAK